MNRLSSLFWGLILILAGIVQFLFTVVISVLDLNLWRWLWDFWPLIVIGLGGLLVSLPLLVRRTRGLAALFIPVDESLPIDLWVMKATFYEG